MVKNCVAANCSNTYGHGVSLFKFPKNPELRQKWIKNVQRTRANWSGPGEHSVLCSQHFESSCFEVDSELAAQMGIQKRRRLKPDAVPTLFDRPTIQLPSASQSQSETDPSESSRKRASTASSSLAGTTKKARTAYEKRERSRVSNKNIHITRQPVANVIQA